MGVSGAGENPGEPALSLVEYGLYAVRLLAIVDGSGWEFRVTVFPRAVYSYTAPEKDFGYIPRGSLSDIEFPYAPG
jgi:hypothetical protein